MSSTFVGTRVFTDGALERFVPEVDIFEVSLQVYLLCEPFVALLAVKRLLALVGEGVGLSVATAAAAAGHPRRGLLDLVRLLLDQHVLSTDVFVSLGAVHFSNVLNHCNDRHRYYVGISIFGRLTTHLTYRNSG